MPTGLIKVGRLNDKRHLIRQRGTEMSFFRFGFSGFSPA